MAAVSVAFDGTRVSNSDTSAGFVAEGATPTSETDYYYQGGGSMSLQVKTAEVGAYYTNTAANINFTTANSVWVAKIIQTNKDAIDGSGLQLKIGNANTAAYLYYIYPTAADYPPVGGWQVICIDPGISQWRGTTIGSPALINVNTYGIRSDASATAKAPNLGMDAIDVINRGTGLTLTRGDGADANGTFTSFITSDETTQTNRWGIVQTRGGILYVNGTLQIGNSTVNTEFTDSNKVLVFPHHRVSNGFCGLKFNIANTGSGITISSSVFNGRGELYTNDDTRPDYTVTGEAGSWRVEGSTFNVFRQMNLTSVCVLSTTSLIAGQRLYQNGANIYSCSVSGAATTNGAAFLIANNPSKILNCDFAFSSNGGHAIEITQTGTFAFNGNFFTGFGANGTGNSAIYNNSGGLVTLNVSGGDTPTVRNSVTSSTTIQSSAILTFNGLVTGSEIKIYQHDTAVYNHVGTYLGGHESVNGFVQSASVVVGGSGYTVSDTLTVQGGTGTAATLTVTGVSGGVITSVSVASNGQYSTDPSLPASVTGGTGSGATFQLEISGEFEYSYSDAGSQVDVIVFHLDYKPERYHQYTLPSSNTTVGVRQIADRVYANP